jgi:pimeloyl-ACP methyl ester carboxylesterase
MEVLFGNIKLHCEKIVPSTVSSDNVVMIFIHEALGSIGQWKSFPKKLCEVTGLKGIVYERQGHGHSSEFNEPRKADYLHRYALDELPNFLDQVLEKNQRVVLVGHSDGGTIALLYASQFPERIEAVITMAAHVINEPETIAGIEPAVQAYKAGKLDGLRKYHGDKTETLFYAWADTWRSQSFRHWKICNELFSEIPIFLCIQGTDDQYGTEEQLKLIKTAIPQAETIMLDECGHHPHLEQMEKVCRLIIDHLSYLE